MSVPPVYRDLGKDARGLFNSGFNYGFYKVEAKSKAKNNIELTTTGVSDIKEKTFNGGLEMKYKFADYGMTFTEKWNTQNTLATELTFEDQFVNGLKVAFNVNFSPNSGKRNAQIKSTYKRDYVSVNADVDYVSSGTTLHGAAVVGHLGWLAGYQMSYDVSKGSLLKNNFSFGYKSSEFALHSSVADGDEFSGSVYHKTSDKLETGVQMNWKSGANSATKFGMSAKYRPDNFSVARVKLDNQSNIGLSYQYELRDGVKMTLSSLFDGKSTSEHKLGLGLEFAA